VGRRYLRERPEMPGAYMTTSEVTVVHAEPIHLSDLAATLLVAAEIPRPPEDCEPLPKFADLSPEDQQLCSYKWVLKRPDQPQMAIPGHDYRPMMRHVRLMDDAGVHNGY
jgi:hypothetical protein